MTIKTIWRALVFAAYCIAQIADFIETFKNWRRGDDDLTPDRKKED